MSYAIIAGVIFAWIVTLAFAASEYGQVRRANKARQR